MQAGTDVGLQFQGKQGTVLCRHLRQRRQAAHSFLARRPSLGAVPPCSHRGTAVSLCVRWWGCQEPSILLSRLHYPPEDCAHIYFVLCVNGTPWRCAERWPWCGDGAADVQTGAPSCMVFSLIALKQALCNFFFFSFFFFFNKLKVSGNPFDAGESVCVTFLAAFAHFMSLRHILVMLTIFQIFHDYYICYCGLWSVICDVTALTHWRFR